MDPETSAITPTETTPAAAPVAETSPLNTDALPSASEPVDEEFSFLRTEAPAAPAVVAPAVPPVPGPAEAMAAAGAQPQVPVSPPVPPVAAAPAVAPLPAPAAAAPQPQAAPAAAPQTPEQVHQAYQEHRQSRIQQLAKQTFALDEATIEAMQTPEGMAETIPLLMAQATMAAMEATTVAFANMLPGAIMQVTEQQTTFKKNEDDFYGAWPMLKKPEYEAQLSQAGALYRQLNPGASKEEFIKAVGGAVAASLGLAQAPAAVVPTAPAAPRPAAHSPIAHSAPRSVGAPQSSGNRFGALVDDELTG